MRKSFHRYIVIFGTLFIMAIYFIMMNKKEVLIENSNLWSEKPTEVTVSLNDGENYTIEGKSYVIDKDNFIPEYSIINYPAIEFSDDALNDKLGEKINQILYETTMLNYSEELEQDVNACYSCQYFIAYADKNYISIYYFETISSGMSRAENIENAVTISLENGNKVSLEDFGDVDSIMQEINNYSDTIYTTDGFSKEQWLEEKEKFIERWIEDENSLYHGYYLYGGRIGFFFNYYRTGRVKIGLEFSGIVDY